MSFDKLDIYIALGAVIITAFLVSTLILAYRGKFPSVQTLQDIATMFNTKGGIVLLLVVMWFLTLSTTVIFGVWVIVKGVDPQNAVTITIFGMLISQAFGNVNGALFKTMTGDDPKPIPTSSSTVTSVLTKESSIPVELIDNSQNQPTIASDKADPTNPQPPSTNASSANVTQGTPIQKPDKTQNIRIKV
jgi:hypothetical protein